MIFWKVIRMDTEDTVPVYGERHALEGLGEEVSNHVLSRIV